MIAFALLPILLAQTTGAQTPDAQPPDVAPQAGKETQGIVVLVSRPLAFDDETARTLCPAPDARLRIVAGPLDPASVDPFAKLGSPTPTLSIDPSVRFAGDEPDVASRASAAQCIVLEGGTWVQWWNALEPQHKLTRLGRALVEAHHAGATIVGVGAAGSYLCELGVISRAALSEPSRDPHDRREHVVVLGLGLVHGACFDFAADGRTTPETMLDALRSSDTRMAVWLAGPCAWIQGADGCTVHVAGSDGSAFLFDLGAGHRTRESILGGRLLRLQAGASFDACARREAGGTIWPVPDDSSAGSADLDERLDGFPWAGNASQADPGKPGFPGKAVDLRGNGSRLRLFPPQPGAGRDVLPSARSPSSARSTQADWIRFDWIQPA